MSDEEREVREALPGTTPPPWTPEMQFTERDFALIPKLVRGVPKLLAEIDRLRALLKGRMKLIVKGVCINGQPTEFESIEFVEAVK